jgi:hypothetical protein
MARQGGGVLIPSTDDVRRIAAVKDPVVRNLQITQTYHELAVRMGQLTGAGANWCTVATWASKQAGQSIRREDLARAFERLLRGTPSIQQRADTMLAASRALNGEHTRSLAGALDALRDAVNPAAAFQRTSDAVARGNVKVFAEIGAEFARFVALFTDGWPDTAALAAFHDGLQPGDPPDGQDYLRRAFEHYGHALRTDDLKQKAQWLLLGNLEIGLHEQTRLQPEIVEAMNAPVVDPRRLRSRLVAELFPSPTSRVRYWLAALAGRMRPWLDARDQLADEAQKVGRLLVTATLMTLTLPTGQVLQLGQDLTSSFPDVLGVIDQPELAALLQRVDPTANSTSGTGVEDWSNLAERMHFIADLFRAYHLAPALFEAPFDAQQVAVINAGGRPAGSL